jgi:hypothetical protein
MELTLAHWMLANVVQEETWNKLAHQGSFALAFCH